MSKSSQLTSIFWFAYGASRIVGIVGSKYLIPRTYILLAMTGTFRRFGTVIIKLNKNVYFSWWNWKWTAFHRVPDNSRGSNWLHNRNLLSQYHIVCIRMDQNEWEIYVCIRYRNC